MITMAIDGSTKNTGIAIFQQGQLIHYQCFSQTNSNVYERILNMIKHIDQIYIKYKPTHVIMEDVLPQEVKHNQQIYKALIYLQAGVVLKLYQRHAKIDFYQASHWRKICGIKTGRGIKRQTLKQASKQLIKNIYNIDVNDDISDAIGLGIAYIAQNRSAF